MNGDETLDLNGDSPGAARLPPLPSSWCWTRVQDISTVVRGGSPRPAGDPRYFGGPVPWITVGSITADEQPYLRNTAEGLTEAGKERSRWIEPETLLLTNSGATLGVPKISLIGGCINDGSVALLNVDYPLKLYLYYFLKSQTEHLRGINQGAAQPNLNTGIVKAIRVPLSPPNEQGRIVAKIEELFSDLDAGVAALKRAKANLKRYRAAVLKAAVEGKLTEEWRAKHPSTEPASKLLERILVERRQKWETDQLAKFAAAGREPPTNWKERYVEPTPPDTTGFPDLPEGWCWVVLDQVARFQNGRAFPSQEYTAEGVRLLRPGNLFADGSVRWTDKNSRFMPREWAERFPTYIVRGNELVINLTAQSLADEFLGRTCLTDSDERCLLNQRLARITPNQEIGTQFTLLLLKSSVFRRFVNGLNTGSLIEHMFTSQLEQCAVPMSPSSEQQQIVAVVDQRLSVIAAADAEIDQSLQRAARLRQSILKQAFEGKLVPQDPNDEPASVLLERLRVNQSDARRTSNGSLKRRGRRVKSVQVDEQGEE